MSVRFIILFGLLALTLVLVNAIAITVNQQAGDPIAQQYCGQAHERYPQGCVVDAVFDCTSHYVLRSECFGVGDVVVANDGSFADWCGYAVFGGSDSASCAKYVVDPSSTPCAIANNLCIR